MAREIGRRGIQDAGVTQGAVGAGGTLQERIGRGWLARNKDSREEKKHYRIGLGTSHFPILGLSPPSIHTLIPLCLRSSCWKEGV